MGLTGPDRENLARWLSGRGYFQGDEVVVRYSDAIGLLNEFRDLEVPIVGFEGLVTTDGRTVLSTDFIADLSDAVADDRATWAKESIAAARDILGRWQRDIPDWLVFAIPDDYG